MWKLYSYFFSKDRDLTKHSHKQQKRDLFCLISTNIVSFIYFLFLLLYDLFEVVSFSYFNLHFLNYKWKRQLFHMDFSHPYVFFEKESAPSLSPFLQGNWIFCFWALWVNLGINDTLNRIKLLTILIIQIQIHRIFHFTIFHV